MEMKAFRLVFPVVLVCFGLRLSSVGAQFTLCTSIEDCNSSLEFCDTSATRTCMSCEDFPCSATYLQDNGDGWCRKVCEDYWMNQVQRKTVTSLAVTETNPHEQGEAQQLEGNEEEAEREMEDNTAVVGKGFYILLAVLCAGVSVGCVIAGRKILVYYRNKNAHPPQEEIDPEVSVLVTGKEAGAHGPILQEQGGV